MVAHPFHLRKNGAGQRVSVTGKSGLPERRDAAKTTDIPTTELAPAVGAGGAATRRPRDVDGRNERTRSSEKGSRTKHLRRGCARRIRYCVPGEERWVNSFAQLSAVQYSAVLCKF